MAVVNFFGQKVTFPATTWALSLKDTASIYTMGARQKSATATRKILLMTLKIFSPFETGISVPP